MTLALVLSAVSIASVVVCLVMLPWIVVRLPEDYFAHERRDPPWSERSVRRRVVSVVRTLVGAVFVCVGIVLLFLPGQGLLMILVGLLVAEFPGKYAVERQLARRPAIRRSIDAIRRRAGRPPLRHAAG